MLGVINTGKQRTTLEDFGVIVTEQKLCKMTLSSDLRQGIVWIDKLFERINQEFKANGTKYQILLNFRICCKELKGLKVASFRTCVSSFCSVCICCM